MHACCSGVSTCSLQPHTCAHSSVLLPAIRYTLFDGQERTTAQFRQLLAAAGWTLRRLLPSSGIFNLLEAVPAA